MPLCSCGCGKIGNCPAGDLQDAVKHAKKVLLKEKIKERLEKKMGKKLDAMADLAIEIYFGKKNMMKEKEARIDAMTSKIDDVMNAP